MGCGIMFPRDYILDSGGEGPVIMEQTSQMLLVETDQFLSFCCPSVLSVCLTVAPSDDSDDGEPEVRPKQRRVHNDLYMNDEDQEEDGEELEPELEGRKVTVRKALPEVLYTVYIVAMPTAT